MVNPLRKELHGSGFHEVSKDGVFGVRYFSCLWNNRFQASPALGEAFPWFPDAKCVRVRFEPLDETLPLLGATTELPDSGYEYCRITAEYSTEQIATDTLPLESFRLAGEACEIGLGRHWSDDGSVSDQPQAVFIPTVEYVLRRKISAAEWEAFKDELFLQVNTVNDATWKGAAAGCLLFNGCDADSEWTISDGTVSKVYNVVYSFTFKRRPFNQFWKASTGAWTTFQEPVYESSDFTQLGLGS